MQVRWYVWPLLLGALMCVTLPAKAQLPLDLFEETDTFKSVEQFHTQRQQRAVKQQLPQPNSQYKSLLTRPVAKPRFASPVVVNPGELSKLEFDDSKEELPAGNASGSLPPTTDLKANPKIAPRDMGQDNNTSPLSFDVSKPIDFEETEFPTAPKASSSFQQSTTTETVDATTNTQWQQDGPYALEPSEDIWDHHSQPRKSQPVSDRATTDSSSDDYQLEPEPVLPDFAREPDFGPVTQNSPMTPYSSDAATTAPFTQSSSDLMYGGYDGMVDSYVDQLLAGGGNNTYTAVTDFGPTWTSPVVDDFSGCGSDCFIAPSGWYADIKALVLNPTNRGAVDVSRDDSGNVALNTRALDIGWSSGVDARLGFRTGASAVEFGWWSLFPASDSIEVTRPAGELLPAINFDFPAAERHRIETELELHSIDFRYVLVSPRSNRLSLGAWWGLRYTRIREELRFESDQVIGVTGDERRYDLDVDNNMIGPQFGGIGQWQLAPRLGLRLEAQVGAYYNYISQDERAGNDIGAFPIASGPNAGQPFDIETTTSTASAISEFNVGLEYQLRPRLRLLGGYRLVAAAGIARTTSQIPDQQGSNIDFEIDASDSLILHGFEIGVDFRF